MREGGAYLLEGVLEQQSEEVEHGKHAVGFEPSQMNADEEPQKLGELVNKTATKTHSNVVGRCSVYNDT